jgi:hypothetical protein
MKYASQSELEAAPVYLGESGDDGAMKVQSSSQMVSAFQRILENLSKAHN